MWAYGRGERRTRPVEAGTWGLGAGHYVPVRRERYSVGLIPKRARKRRAK